MTTNQFYFQYTNDALGPFYVQGQQLVSYGWIDIAPSLLGFQISNSNSSLGFLFLADLVALVAPGSTTNVMITLTDTALNGVTPGLGIYIGFASVVPGPSSGTVTQSLKCGFCIGNSIYPGSITGSIGALVTNPSMGSMGSGGSLGATSWPIQTPQCSLVNSGSYGLSNMNVSIISTSNLFSVSMFGNGPIYSTSFANQHTMLPLSCGNSFAISVLGASTFNFNCNTMTIAIPFGNRFINDIQLTVTNVSVGGTLMTSLLITVHYCRYNSLDATKTGTDPTAGVAGSEGYDYYTFKNGMSIKAIGVNSSGPFF